jgi:hypothetical protein
MVARKADRHDPPLVDRTTPPSPGGVSSLALPAPAWLGHKQPKPQKTPVRGGFGRFDPHQKLRDCATNIASATDSKWRTLREEAFIAGSLVRDGFLEERVIRHTLEGALAAMARRANDVQHMYDGFEDAFAEGLAAPSARRARR